jgi:GNAT superfamily N-acetyltransferase
MRDAELYRRGTATLIASWAADASGVPGAALRRLPGVAAAVFPDEPERTFFNNALLERADAIEAMEAAYAEAGVTGFRAWVHERDGVLRAALERRGYTLDETTRAMGMVLDDLRVPRPDLVLAPPDWSEYLRTFALPPDLLRDADHAALHLVLARENGTSVAAALAFDWEGDCGIYNVATIERARRRGLGTALTALQLHAARDRGCRTASIQSTPMAERVYAAVGFRDLGRILEYAPR